MSIAAEKKKNDDSRIRLENARRTQVELFLDIIGNPFSEAPSYLSSLSARHAILKTEAEFIYWNRRFDLLPALADILEEVGCTSREVLSHCLQNVEHTRGCWVIDSLLDKK